jgi:hydroxyacylglutathione hydrolase
VLYESAGVGFAFQQAHDGETLDLGNVVLSVLHTPGHTPEHISLLVTDRTRAPEPWALLSGHTLMVGDVGRTELAGDAASGARTLFASLARLKALPDYLEVLAGCLCRLGLRPRTVRQAVLHDRLRAAV